MKKGKGREVKNACLSGWGVEGGGAAKEKE